MAFLLFALGVVTVHGSCDAGTMWNLVPLVLSYLVLVFTVPRTRTYWKDIPRHRLLPAVGFCVGATGLTTLAHLAWYFDWGGTATGSSTAGLLFIFLPAYALGLGLVGLLAGLWFGVPSTSQDKGV